MMLQTMNWKSRLVLGLVALFAVAGAAEVPRPEHPRPDQFRPAWQNLNGAWEFQADPGNAGLREAWFESGRFQEQIQVPYPIESELSGLHRANPAEVNWYRLRLAPDAAVLSAPRQLLHFGAVDYSTTVWLNGQKLGDHIGGYTPFVFEVTGILKSGENVLVVRVFDSKSRSQVRGKQTWNEKPSGILYTGVTGIWQTVWLEGVGRAYLDRYQVDFYPKQNQVRIRSGVQGPTEGLSLVAEVNPEGSPGLERHGPSPLQPGGAEITWTQAAPKLWSPDTPSLYSLALVLQDKQGKVVDRVEGYFGLRNIEARDGKIFLNGREFYQKTLLDQGYFPGGWYAAATDEDYRRDVETYQAMGFNGLRKHQKV
jgi:beta-galactosidase/beta-glucuronidase